MDPFGNEVRSTDEYGNPIPHHGGAAHVDHHRPGGYSDLHGTAGHVNHQTGVYGAEHGTGAAPAVLRRSGSSSSSSSSEDDGLGGRRKKNKAGIKDKIKAKLPGGHKDDRNPQLHQAQGVAAGGHYDHGVAAGEQTQEKKGIMEKIKEKLPGSHGR